MSALVVTPMTGEAARARLDDLAALRIAVFAEWPYLYDGDLDYEARYLTSFAAAEGALIVCAFDGERMVGAATAGPLAAQGEDIRAAFVDAGRAAEDIFYFGESVLAPAYRGRGVGHAFFDAREAHARASGARWAGFCAVVRDEDDPRRPSDARSLEPFWRKRGYAPLTDRLCHISWKERGEAAETAKPLQAWLRAL